MYRQSPKSAWLLDRIAAKDAVRDWMLRNRGLKLHALEVEIGNRADGSPEVVGLDGARLALSISHLEDEANALVTAGERAGVDVVGIMDRAEDLESLSFTRDEMALLPNGEQRLEWIHRAWAAKEAAMKAARRGLADLPHFEIVAVSPNLEQIEVRSRIDGSIVPVRTSVDAGRAIAIVAQ